MTNKELCKAINGKLLWWKIVEVESTERVQVILIIHEDMMVVSVKPYGYTPEVLCKKLKKAHSHYAGELADLRNPKFCFSTFSSIEALEKLAQVRENSIKHFYDFIPEEGEKGFNPVCPY